MEEDLLRSLKKGGAEKMACVLTVTERGGGAPWYADDIRLGNDGEKLKTGESDPRRVRVNSLVWKFAFRQKKTLTGYQNNITNQAYPSGDHL